MTDIITDCLGTRWAMFYVRQMPIDKLTSMQTLEKSIDLVNQNLNSLGRNLSIWPAGMQDEICRLLWVNWIYQRLNIEPIRKPIITHFRHGQYYVDCGDTRLMSLRLYNSNTQVPIIVTCSIADIDQFSTCTRIHNTNELKTVCGFGQDACVMATPAEDWCLYWLEIGDHSTAHHLHDINQRLSMMQQYISLQPFNFQFTKEWITSSIDWTDYQSNW